MNNFIDCNIFQTNIECFLYICTMYIHVPEHKCLAIDAILLTSIDHLCHIFKKFSNTKLLKDCAVEVHFGKIDSVMATLRLSDDHSRGIDLPIVERCTL